MDKITVVIANKFFLMNYAIRCILQQIPEFVIHGIPIEQLQEELPRLKPEILIFETGKAVHENVCSLKEIKRRYPDLRIIVLIDEGDEECYEAIAELRPEGCLYKHTSQDELIAAVKTVFKGKKYMTPGFSHTPGNDTSSPGTSDNSRILRLLTNREKEILQHIINGKSKHEIANELFISANTVVTHRKKIMAKLGVNNTTRLILVSLKSGLIPLPD